ncbi:MAG TPA: alpha/beta fold hydrolase [Longimicrobium sp.]|nr:alpha/beta fold hydrolase [Longimicrobium sp.]
MNVIRSVLAALAAAAVLGGAPAQAQTPGAGKTVAGSWGGALEPGPVRLRMKLMVQPADSGFSATFVSVDQGGASFPATVQTTADSVIFTAAAVGGSYRAVLSANGDTLTGTWHQGAGTLPLVMVRGADAEMVVRRPQEPQRPFPYREEEVSYASVPGVRLAGTLTLPAGEGPHPAVLLVTGSGPQDRDETLFNHRPFLLLADYLTRRGIAVLRVDDRGVGQSTGSFPSATSEDFARDALAGVRFLYGRADIGPVGIIGHSEGGMIAPMVAARSPDVRFLVLLAGPGIPIPDLMRLQANAVMRSMGGTEAQIQRLDALRRDLYAAVQSEADSAALHARLLEIGRQFRAGLAPREQGMPGTSDAEIAESARLMTTPWWRFFLRYDPAATLRRVRVPVLALNGSLDVQVIADENLAGIRQALTGNPDATVEKMEGLNHLFQTARTGGPAEYGQIEETIAPAVLQRIGDWILERVGRR